MDDDQIDNNSNEVLVPEEVTLEEDTTLEDTSDDSLSEASEEGMMASPTPTPQEDAFSVMNLEGIIKRHILDIERIQEEMKKRKEMYEDLFENDAEYATKTEALEQAKRERNVVRDRLMQQSSVVDMSQKIDESKQEIKDLKESLSAYLEEFQKTSKTNQIEIDKGDIREIIQITKLVKKGTYRP